MTGRAQPDAPIDLNDLDLFVSGDPHSAWSWLRQNAPVYWNPTPEGGFWALTKYEDVSAAYIDASAFSSRFGTVLGGSYRSAADTATNQMLICSDPPDHRLLRQQVHKAFAPWMIEKATRRVVEFLGTALDKFVAAGGGDFATEVALELPAGFLSAMFDLGRDDAFRLLRLTRSMIGHKDPEYAGPARTDMTLVASQVEIFDMISELMERRRREPGGDLVSILCSAEINGRPMTDSQILYNCLNVAVGGNETTPYTATAAVLALADHPDQAERLIADPGLLGPAVEEVFRWTSTNAYVQRTATRDVEIRGTLIRAGESVTLWNASANRDEEQFPAPDVFDLSRAPNQHLAFGVAAHRCIGMGGARQEITLLMRALAERRLRFRVAGPVERLRSNFMLGIRHLPVTVAVG
ncbi:cytochrome P450 [Streptomyces naphthomycinicus]|uniref:cytochrome P450 n=1 Tax=Streptomyces naphthomycinicus TaxID=2872625 RepID=UPI001CEC62FD|nr:cytochrome P450 [Streptomyces sp. TML10]